MAFGALEQKTGVDPKSCAPKKQAALLCMVAKSRNRTTYETHDTQLFVGIYRGRIIFRFL